MCKLGKKSWLDIKGSQYSFSLNSHYRRPRPRCQRTTSTTIKHLFNFHVTGKSCENVYFKRALPSSTAGWQSWSLVWCWKCGVATETHFYLFFLEQIACLFLWYSLISPSSDLLNNFATEQNSLCLCEKVYSSSEMRVLSRNFNPLKPIPGGVGMLWCLFRQRADRYIYIYIFICSVFNNSATVWYRNVWSYLSQTSKTVLWWKHEVL